MKPLLLALLLAAGCKHSSSASSSSHSETQTTTDTTSSESGAITTTTTQTEGPSKTVTVTEEYGPPEKEAAPEGAASAYADGGTPSERAPVLAGRPTIPRLGPLVKRTVTTTEHAADTTQTRQEATREAQGVSETRAAAKVDAKAQEAEKGSPALSCAFGGWLAIAGVVAALFGLGYFALKRLRNPV